VRPRGPHRVVQLPFGRHTKHQVGSYQMRDSDDERTRSRLAI
jgi:hypothetical protein